jgi:hypothetical protein
LAEKWISKARRRKSLSEKTLSQEKRPLRILLAVKDASKNWPDARERSAAGYFTAYRNGSPVTS